MKARIRADLSDALKARRGDEVALLRSLLAAIDNAEAPPVGSQPDREGPGEVDRLVLTATELQAVLAGEIAARESAAAEIAPLGHPQRAETLRTQAGVARRYLAATAPG